MENKSIQTKIVFKSSSWETIKLDLWGHYTTCALVGYILFYLLNSKTHCRVFHVKPLGHLISNIFRYACHSTVLARGPPLDVRIYFVTFSDSDFDKILLNFATLCSLCIKSSYPLAYLSLLFIHLSEHLYSMSRSIYFTSLIHLCNVHSLYFIMLWYILLLCVDLTHFSAFWVRAWAPIYMLPPLYCSPRGLKGAVM